MSIIPRSLVVVSFCACTSGSPLQRVTPQVEIAANPGNVPDRPMFTLSMTTWNDLDVLADAMTSGELTATLDGKPLMIDHSRTGYFGGHDSYVAAFGLPGTMTALQPSKTSSIVISDRTVTWSAQIDDLFANDLAATAPTVPGQNTFVWPSAASSAPYSTIAWACVDVAGQTAACGGYEATAQAIDVSQHYITANLSGPPGTTVSVTAERSANRDSTGDGPTFLTRIVDRLDTAL